MRFQQIISFYEQYLDLFYSRNPQLLSEEPSCCLDKLLLDGFAAGHCFASAMVGYAYDAQMVIGNDIVSQFKWAQKNSVKLSNPEHWKTEIVRKQIEAFKPDVLFLSDPLTFDGRFVRSLKHHPLLTIGWRAADIPAGTDWRGFDLILSHQQKCRDRALRMGACRAEYFIPGFPAWVGDAVASLSSNVDVVFCGQWNSTQHTRRNDILQVLLKASRKGTLFSMNLHLLIPKNSIVPEEILSINSGCLWGLDMYRAIRSAKIAFNAESDLNQGEAGNMRLFETTGIGAFLLTEYHPNIEQYFITGTEIETYANKNELIEKIFYYRAADSEREEIARRGMERCRRDYSMERTAEHLNEIIQRNIKLKTKSQAKDFVVGSSEGSSSKNTRNPVNIEGRHVQNPLVQGGSVEKIRSHNPSIIMQKYAQIGIDVSRFVASVQSVDVYRCDLTGYEFFYPFSLTGDADFYADLSRHDWYYMPWKWEQSMALPFIPQNTRVVEVGPGNGAFLKRLAKRGCSAIGLEMNEAACNKARAQNIDMRNMRVEDFAEAEQGAFDVVCMFQVLEHVVPVREFLDSCLRLLKVGGILIVSVPNNESYMFRKDPEHTLNMPPHHMGLWSLRSLISLQHLFPVSLERVEFEPLQLYHKKYYIDILYKDVAKFCSEISSESKDDVRSIIDCTLQSLDSNVNGHTILAIYTKLK
jgi:2-polyprenyl-3-methyl-5-hydroxy-6-metoxy-1,4-benzoquinol methylase